MSSKDRRPPLTAAIWPNHPDVAVRPVVDPQVIDQARMFAEVQRQMSPFAKAGTPEATQVARFSRQFTARPHGLKLSTAVEQATRSRSIDTLIAGPQHAGNVKELVVAHDIRELLAGRDPNMVNAPTNNPANVIDVRTAPDSACKRDIVYRVQTKDGQLLTVPGGQVKTGSAAYLTESLVDMAATPGYGRLAHVDARFVNPDGTPRVAADAFTPDQARRLREAGVKLRGIRDLDKRGDLLARTLAKSQADALDPIARKELEMLRDDIAQAYGSKQIAGRIAAGAALAAATAIVIALAVQLVTTGTVDPRLLWHSLWTAGASGAVAAAADAGVYHAAVHSGLVPEAAKSVAQYSVAAGFAVVSIISDVRSELRALRAGELTTKSAVVGIATKVCLDLVPLAVAPLGILGVPIVVIVQLGGRWLLARWRERDAVARAAVAQGELRISHLQQQADSDARATTETLARVADTDALFARVFGGTSTTSSSPLTI